MRYRPSWIFRMFWASCSFLLSWSWSLLSGLVLTGQEDAERIAPLHPAKATSLIRILLQVQNGADTGNYN